MNYNKRLKEFFNSKGYKNKELVPILGYSETMISRYLSGVREINMRFLNSIVNNFPDIDLNYIFKGTTQKLPNDER